LHSRWVDAHLDNLRRTAECAAVGLLWTAFSIPVVTAGAAWIAAATIFDAWTRGEEPPLLSTFVTAVRRRLLIGLVAQLVVAVVAVVAYLDIRFASAAHVPGANLEVAAVGLFAAGAIGVVQLALAHHARTGQPSRDAVRQAWIIARSAPWVVPLVVVATAVCAGLVALVPALILFIAGPLAYAVSVAYARAVATHPDGDATHPDGDAARRHER